MTTAIRLKRSQELYNDAVEMLHDHQNRLTEKPGSFFRRALVQSTTALVRNQTAGLLQSELAYTCELYDRLKSIQFAASDAFHAIQDNYVYQHCTYGFSPERFESYKRSEIQYCDRKDKLQHLYRGLAEWQRRIRKKIEELEKAES